MRNKKHFAVFVVLALIMAATVGYAIVSINNAPADVCENCTVTNDTVIHPASNATKNATAMVDATKIQQNKTQLNKQNTKLLYFYQDDCPYCVEMEPTIARLVSGGYHVRMINLTSDPNGKTLVKQYGIVSTPTLILNNSVTNKNTTLVGVYTYGMVIEDVMQIGG